MSVRDVSFWEDRLKRGVAMGEPHRGVVDESIEWWEAANEVSRKVLEKIITFFHPKSILDAGCGIGTLSAYIPPGIYYTGIDLVPAFIDYARRECRPNDRPWPSFFIGDIRKLDYHDGEIDLVIARSVEGTVRKGYGEETWLAVEKELTRVSRTVLVSMGLYRPDRYDVIKHDGSRLICILEDHEDSKL